MKKKFEVQSGGAVLAAPAQMKEPEMITDASRTYGTKPKAIAGSYYNMHQIQPTGNSVPQTKAIGTAFKLSFDTINEPTNWSRLLFTYGWQIGLQANRWIFVSGRRNAIIYAMRLRGKLTGSIYGVMEKRFVGPYQEVIRPRRKALQSYLNNEKKDGLFRTKLPPSLNYTGFTAKVGETSNMAAQLAGSMKETEPANFLPGKIIGGAYPADGCFDYKEVNFGDMFECCGVFGINKNVHVDEPCTLEIDIDLTSVGHSSLSPTNPFATPLALTGNVLFRNFIVHQPIEQDPGAVKEAKDETARGLPIPVPWPKQELIPGAIGATNQPRVVFVPSDGTLLRNVTIAPFRTDGLLNFEYDHSNYVPGDVADGTGGGKFRDFKTHLDNTCLQGEVAVVTSIPTNPSGENLVEIPNQDYMLQRHMLQHSLIQDLEMYRKFWSWCDDFCGEQNPMNEVPYDALGGVMVVGGPSTGRIWQFTTKTLQKAYDATGVTPASYVALTYFVHAELTQYLVPRVGGSAVIPFLQPTATAPLVLPANQVVAASN